jgi:hypothetical protein
VNELNPSRDSRRLRRARWYSLTRTPAAARNERKA